MNFKIQDLAIARNNEFDSPEAVTLAKDELIGVNTIRVLDGNFITFYVRSPGATDLKDGNDDTWRIASITPANQASLAADLAQLFTTTPRAFGVWTPALAWTGGGGSFTYTNQEGMFYLDGNGVDLRANLTVTPNSGGGGNLALTGLPFPVRGGAFPSWLDVRFDTFNFQTPYGANGFTVRATGGNNVGVFSYDAGANHSKIYVTGLSTTPIGNATTVALGASGKTAQIVDFEADPDVADAGYVTLFKRYGEITNGMTLTGAARDGFPSWTGTAVVPTKTWYGASAETSFLASSLVQRGEVITMEISGRILI